MTVLDLKSYFCGMKNPRIDRRKEHNMEDLIFISIACLLCGRELWYDVAENYGMMWICIVNFNMIS